MTTIKKFEIWIADLEPQRGTETGKVRPVLIVQTDYLNKIHPSTIICPITTNVQTKSNILRVHLSKGDASLSENCDVMIDQIRAIDNRRLIKRIGQLPKQMESQVKRNIITVLGLNE